MLCNVFVISGYLCVVLCNCTGSIILSVPGYKIVHFAIPFILYVCSVDFNKSYTTLTRIVHGVRNGMISWHPTELRQLKSLIL